MPFILIIIVSAVILIALLWHPMPKELLKEERQVWLLVEKEDHINEVKAYITLSDEALVLRDIAEKETLLNIPYRQIISVEDHVPRAWADRWPMLLIGGSGVGPATTLLSLFIAYKEKGEEKAKLIKFQSNASNYYKNIKSTLREKSPNIVTMAKIKQKSK